MVASAGEDDRGLAEPGLQKSRHNNLNIVVLLLGHFSQGTDHNYLATHDFNCGRVRAAMSTSMHCQLSWLKPVIRPAGATPA